MKRKNYYLLSVIFLVFLITGAVHFWTKNRNYIAIKEAFNVSFTKKDLFILSEIDQWNENGDGYRYVKFKVLNIDKAYSLFISRNAQNYTIFPDQKLPPNSFPQHERNSLSGYYLMNFDKKDSSVFDMLLLNKEGNVLYFYSQSQ